MAKMGDGFLSGLMNKLTSNPHMAPLAAEVQTLTVRVVSSVLGDALKNTDKYDGLIDQFAGKLDSVLEMAKEERSELLSDTVKQIFAEYEVDVPPEVVIELSEKAITELGADGKIDAEELKQFLIDHAGELDFAGDILDDFVA